MALSKKQAKEIANLVNGVSAWHSAVKDACASTECDYSRIRRFMDYHDNYAQQLNRLLGLVAVTTYCREDL